MPLSDTTATLPIAEIMHVCGTKEDEDLSFHESAVLTKPSCQGIKVFL
jgi:hypothetical protein